MALAGVTSPAGRADIGIGRLLRRAHGAFSRELRRKLAGHGVTFGEFIHLERLWDEDGLNQTEIARRVGIAAASSTQIIATLHRRGLIVRRRNAGDRRRLDIHLTREGRRLKTSLRRCARAVNRLSRRGLSQRDVCFLFDTVEKIVAGLARIKGADSRS